MELKDGERTLEMKEIDNVTKVKAVLELIWAVGDAIREAPTGIPSGELYAMLMGVMSLETYLALVEKLKEAGLVQESNYLLKWVGPPKPKEVRG